MYGLYSYLYYIYMPHEALCNYSILVLPLFPFRKTKHGRLVDVCKRTNQFQFNKSQIANIFNVCKSGYILVFSCLALPPSITAQTGFSWSLVLIQLHPLLIRLFLWKSMWLSLNNVLFDQNSNERSENRLRRKTKIRFVVAELHDFNTDVHYATTTTTTAIQ